MLTSKKSTLRPLLESVDGLHLTIYLVNQGNVLELKSQLRSSLKQSFKSFDPVMTTEERNKFLEPLYGLLDDVKILKQMKGNIGIFRNKDFFKIMNIPIEIEHTCHVATSFHVKPLLKWLQHDQEFLFLGMAKDSAQLYLGSQDSLKLVDSIILPDSFKNNDFSTGMRARDAETFEWLNDWILELTKNSSPKLFLAGEKTLISGIQRVLKYKNTVKNPVLNTFSQSVVTDICFSIRKILKEDSKKHYEKTLLEFQIAEDENLARKNIFQIAKAVVRGRVRKLIVTDELNIFGKIDKKSGGLALHPYDQDHEDDDILDDLAQMVLSQGGEVIIASRDEIPQGRPILAILNDFEQNLEKRQAFQKFSFLQQRFG